MVNKENIVGQFPYESSSEDRQHMVTVYKTGVISCSCRGFSTPNKCWHVRDRADKLGRVLDTSTWGAMLGPALSAGESNIVQKLSKGKKSKSSRSNEEEVGYNNLMVKRNETHPADTIPAAEPLMAELFDSNFLPFIDVMCASALKEGMEIADYTNDDWYMELKVDGHRFEVQVNEAREILATSRSGKGRVLPAHIIRQLKLCAPATYDGELFLPGGVSTDVTRKDIQHKLKLALFDILRVGSTECMDLPSTERRALLNQATSRTTDDAVHVITQYAVSSEGLQAIWDSGGEGIIIKKKGMRYFAGKRPKEWIKFKKAGAAVTIIDGFEKGSLGPWSKVLSHDQHGVKVRVKSLNDAWRAEFAKNADAYIGEEMVITYQIKTPDGKYRHPMADHMVNKEIR
jgi:hypothetical protein